MTARSSRHDDRGSMPAALLVTIVGVLLSAAILPLILDEIHTGRASVHRSHALDAAQAGLDDALAQIQEARASNGTGVTGALPCGPLNGWTNVAAASYQVNITYLTTDPQGRSPTPLGEDAIACIPDTGPASIPSYALLQSTGTDVPGAGTAGSARTLRATYRFRTGAQTVGGLISVYRSTAGPSLCLDAGQSDPPPGITVLLQACGPGSTRQSFAYNLNLTLVLVTTRTPNRPRGLCLDAGTLPHATDRTVRLQPCAAPTNPQQQWIFNGDGNLEGTTAVTTADGFCFNVRQPDTAGSTIVLGSLASATCHGNYDNTQTFTPEPAVGTGPVGAYQQQLVNLGQFGRCLDVTGANVTTAYLIAHACQPANVSWEQSWKLPTPATEVPAGDSSTTAAITVTSPTGTYCLQSPGLTIPGRYVTIASCAPDDPPLNMRWTVYGDTGRYLSSYRVVDAYGYCLSLTSPTDPVPDLAPVGQQTSKIIVAECDSSPIQKWNAPPDGQQSQPLKDLTEN